MTEPSYLKLYHEGELSVRVKKLFEMMESCCLCPRQCGVNRLEGETGFCGTGRWAKVASYNAHFGEEDPLVGRHGSGTIFLSSCNLLCSFCQNYDISHRAEGVEVGPEQMAAVMLHLAESDCHNINFVTPSHVVPQIVEALILAVDQGLKVPLVYNSSGYDARETLALLDGIFDIFMPDLVACESGFACWGSSCSRSAPRSSQPVVLKYVPGLAWKYSRYRSLLPRNSEMQSCALGITSGILLAAKPTNPLLHRA